MIKQLFLLLFLLQFQIISYAVECESYVKTCSNPGAETTVFIDLNSKTEGTNREINCARKAACEGKQNMIVFPGSDASINPNNMRPSSKNL